MFGLNEPEEILIYWCFDVIEVNDATREIKTKCQSFRFDKIGITFKPSILTENIFGEVKEFDDNTVLKNYGELEKPILDLENSENALGILISFYDFPEWNQIREILGYGYWYSDNLTV